MARKILYMLRRTNRVLAILIGMVLLLCAGAVLLDIVLRRLGSSFGGTDEIAGYVMAVVSAWGMGFAMLELAMCASTCCAVGQPRSAAASWI